MPAFDQFRHLAVEEREQQRANVCAIDIRVGHDDDAVITQFGDVEIVTATFSIRAAARVADAGSERGDECENFVAGQQFFVTRFFDV